MDDAVFAVIGRYVSQPGQILNAVIIRKILEMTEERYREVVEQLVSEGYAQRTGGQFLMITEKGTVRVTGKADW